MSYTKGEMVSVQSCDKFQWCEVDGNFLKSYRLKFIKDNQYEIKNEKTYVYQKNSVLREKYPEFTRKFSYVTDSSFYNYIFGYTRLDIFNEKYALYQSSNQKEEAQVVKSTVAKIANTSKTNKENIIQSTYPYFVSILVGKSSLNISQNDYSGTPTINNQALNDSATFIDFSVGTYLKKNIFTQIGLSQTKLDLSKVLDLSAELNYEFETIFQPYVGLNLGMSQLKWKGSPLVATTTNNDSTSISYSYGLQAGIKYKIKKNIFALIKYKYIKYDGLKTTLQPTGSNSEILYEDANQFGVGIQYKF